AQARERLLLPGRRVSRFGAIPKPTVTVRMKENGCGSRALVRGCIVPCAMIQMLQDPPLHSPQSNPIQDVDAPDVVDRPPRPAYPRFAKPQRVAFVQS